MIQHAVNYVPIPRFILPEATATTEWQLSQPIDELWLEHGSLQSPLLNIPLPENSPSSFRRLTSTVRAIVPPSRNLS